MQVIASETQFVHAQVVPDQKADAADGDEQHQRDQNQRIVGIRGERGIGAPSAEQVETGIAEGGNRGENRGPQSAPESEIPTETERKQDGARRLTDQRTQCDFFGQADDAADMRGIDAFREQLALPDADLAAEDQGENRCNRHKTKTAELDQEKNDGLSEGGPERVGVPQDQARDAGSRSRREKRLPESGACTAACGNGKHEKQCSQDDNQEKAQSNDLRLRKPQLSHSLPP